MMIKKTLPLCALGCALGLWLTAPAGAATIKGTVVHRNARAHSFAVAQPGGRLAAVHSRRSPRLGRLVAVTARKLRNGTYAAKRVRASGVRRHATVRGTVTYSNGSTGDFTVSSRGVSVLVHRGHSAARRLRAANDVPPVGTEVEANVSVDDQGDLEAQDVQQTGQDTGTIDLEGTVVSTDTAANAISVSADDEDRSGASVVVHVPDATQFSTGDQVELTVTGPAADGSFELVQSSNDGSAQEADTPDQGDQGDQQGDQADQGDSQDGSQQDGPQDGVAPTGQQDPNSQSGDASHHD